MRAERQSEEAPKWIGAARRPAAEHGRDAIVDGEHGVDEDRGSLSL